MSSSLPTSAWRLRDRTVAVDRPVVVGIVNVTPDSFSDGGKFFSTESAAAHGARLLEDGADVLDVGGESTRPQGARPVDVVEERRRVLPVIARLRREHPHAVLSVDTVKSEIAEGALHAGADIINDVSACRLDPRMAEVCARFGAGVILMHSRGTVSDMATYEHATYRDVVSDVIAELRASAAAVEGQGVSRNAIVLDPGIGFAKRSEHSLAVLGRLDRLVAVGYPVAVGVSRKRFIGELSGVSEPTERADGTLAANVMALAAGARIFRVHDVLAARRALAVAWAIASSGTTT